ncbi:MAG: hypothetical protein WBW71_14905 [Bacteroidota bacterium]
MIIDAPNFEMLVGKPVIFAEEQAKQNQLPEGEGYVFDWNELLRLNPPATISVEKVKAKQVLTGQAGAIDSLAKEFPKLVTQWREETFHLSSLTKIYAHPAYQRIMAMGTDGLSLVLSELQKKPDRWFYALKFMAGEDVAAGMKNEDARAAWLEWGYKNNYI